MDADVLLRGATVVDGTGGESFTADVAIKGDRIAALGDLATVPANRVLDLSGQVVCPGFIDIHAHSDMSLLQDPAGESKVLQGVTTEVNGNCSLSPFPLAAERLDLHRTHLAGMGGEELSLSWSDLDGYAARIAETPPAINMAALVGHGSVRTAVMGIEQRPASPAELADMKRLVAESLDQGAFGMSTGLTLAPSAYGNAAEVGELVRVVASRDAMYATHARSPVGDGFPEVEEAISTSLQAGGRLQFSHAAINEPAKWGRAADYVKLFEAAERNSLDVGFDVYPYDASSSRITQYLPLWVQDGGLDAMRQRMSDPEVRSRAERELAAGWMGGIPWLWDRVVLCSSHPGYEHCVGLSMEEAAARIQADPVTFTLDLALEYGDACWVVMHYRTEEDMATFLSHRLAVACSDGLAVPLEQGSAKPHPRYFGSFPRLLGRYVREQRLLPLAEMVNKMTGAVAERLRLADRGTLRVGAIADLVVFDPDTVTDRATFTDPAQAPVGINHVVVNGAFVVDDGKQTGARPGHLLRRST